MDGLTEKQKSAYSRYRAEGLPPEEALRIATRSEEQSKVNKYLEEGLANRNKNAEAWRKPVTNFTIGLGKGAVEVGRNLAGTAQDIGQFALDNTVGKALGVKAGGFDILEGETPEILQADNDIQRAGMFAAELGSFIAPQGQIRNATTLLSRALGGGFRGTTARTAAEAGTQGALAYGITQDPATAAIGAGFGAAGVPLQAGFNSLRTVFKPAILEEAAEITARTGNELNEQVLKDTAAREFNKRQSVLISSLKDKDKTKAQEMFEKALRQEYDVFDDQYPIDIVGNVFINRVKEFENIQAALGKEVDKAAQTLRGVEFDTTPIKNKADELLEELDIKMDINGDKIKFNFKDSPFDLVPTAQATIEKILRKAYELPNDAYKTHIFKKTVDELGNFSKNVEGLSAKAQRILSDMRKSADDGLDSTFEVYKKANDDFRVSAQVQDLMEKAFGEFVDSAKAGQLVRTTMSRSPNRGKINSAFKELDEFLKANGVPVEENLRILAKFSEEVLEPIFGAPVASLKGQVESGVNAAAKGLNLLKNPVGGTLDIAGDIVNRVLTKDDQARIEFLKKFFGVK